MWSYFKTERTKLKRTFFRKLLVIAPLMTCIIAYLAGGMMNFQAQSIYWWYTFILPGMTALACVLLHQKEEASNGYFLLFSSPVKLRKVWLAKIGVVCLGIMLSGMIIVLPIHYINIMAPAVALYSTAGGLAGLMLIALTTLWQIPLCLAAAKKIGITIPVIVNTLMGMFTPLLLADRSYWFVSPYYWTPKLMEVVLGIKGNGSVLEKPAAAGGLIGSACIGLAVILFLLVYRLTAGWFERMEAGK